MISAVFDNKALLKRLEIEAKKHEQKQVRAVNSGLKKINTVIRRAIQKKYNIKYKHTKIKLKKIRNINDSAYLQRFSGVIFADYGKGSLKGIANKYTTPEKSWVLKDKKIIFHRTTKKRMPIERTKAETFTINAIYNEKTGSVKLEDFISKEYERQLKL